MFHSTFRPALLLIVVATAAFTSACSSPARQFCEIAGECDEGFALWDPVGGSDDSVEVCVSDTQTTLDIFNANSEEECRELAVLLTEYHNCVIEYGCEAFEVLEAECNNERSDFFEKYGETQNRCNE